MGRIVAATRWVWDFVIGDPIMVGGVLIAVLLTWGAISTSSKTLHDVAWVLFVAVVVASLTLSLRQGAA